MARPSFRMSALTARLLCSAAILFLPGMAHANPVGAQVVAGSATVAQPSRTATTITQQSEKTIIDWQSFSIGQGETTTFKQPNAKAITLNRVTGGDPSAILGTLTANGQVWLINPNGIAFGKSARVDVAGLLATTIDIANNDFMSGNYRFQSVRGPNTMVTNAGQITIHDAGLAALVAPGVANSGIIEADLGQVQLSSASAFTVDLYGDGLFNITLDKQVTQAIRKSDGTPATAAVENSGKLIADGGKVLLTANAAKSVVDHAIDMTGYIQATSASVTQNGDIVLDGGSAGTVAVAGTLDASGAGQGQRGGTAEVTGENVQLSSTANINVSGDIGGGTAHVGGDEHGTGPLPNASTTSVAAGATIHADAAANGNGGSVVVWSDGKTDFQGSISAIGGTESGDGDSAEVSSHGLLNFTGTADLRAARGITGSLLLDPENVTIQASGADTVTPTDPSGTSYTGNVDNSIITTATLQNALALADVTVSTGSGGSQAGDITVASTLSWGSDHSLTLSAYRNITINDSVVIANTGAGDLALRADNTGTGVGTIIFNGVARVDYGGSTGTVSLFYNPADSPAGSVINSTSYLVPADFSSYVLTNSTVTNQFIPYVLVNTVYDLQNIQNNLSGDYALGRDIDAEGVTISPIGAASTDLGCDANCFAGIFDGQGYTITNLNIAESDLRISSGLFSAVSSSGVIRDIGLIGGSVTGSGLQLVGGLVGFNYGLVTRSFVTASVYSNGSGGGLVGENLGTISQSYATSAVEGAVGNVGGLVGYNAVGGTISRSYATGSVHVGDNSRVGGLVGSNVGNITYSYATGAVDGGDYNSSIGGLAGVSTGSIAYSYATGVETGGDYNSFVGGLVGHGLGTVAQSYAIGAVEGGRYSSNVGGLAGTNFDGPITSSYWDSQTTDQVVGAGLGDESGITGLTTAQFKSGLPSGFDPSIWAESPTINFGYPYLLANPPAVSPAQPPVAPGSITWSVADVTSTYGTLATLGAATLNGVGVVDQGNVFGTVGLFADASLSDPVSLSVGLHAGTYYEAVTGLTGSAAGNYTLADTGNVLGQLTVDPKMLTWVVADANSTYGTQAILGSAMLTGVLSGDTGNVQPVVGVSKNGTPVILTATTSAGTYNETVTALSGTAAGNYALAASGNADGTLMINPKTLTWSVADASYIYGNTPVIGRVELFGLVAPDMQCGNVCGTVSISAHGGTSYPSASTLPATYSEIVVSLSGTGGANYRLATSGNGGGQLTVYAPGALLSDSAQTSNPIQGSLLPPNSPTIIPIVVSGYIPESTGEQAVSTLLSSPTAWQNVDTVISAFMYLNNVAHLSDISDPNLRNAIASHLVGDQVYGYATTAFINVLADALEKDGVIPRDFSRSVFVSVMSTGSNMASFDLFGQVVGQSIAILEQIAALKNDGTNLANTLATQGLTYVTALDEADRLRDLGQTGMADRIQNATQNSISATTSSLESWAASSPWKTPSEVDYKWHIITVLITAREMQNEGHAAAAAQEVENARQYAANLDDNAPVLGIFSFGFGSDYQNFFSTVAASFGFAGV